MDTYAIVRPEHLNHQGALFGGQLLLWVDEYAWMAASLDFPHKRLVTRALNAVDFKHSIPSGSILRFHIVQTRVKTTSTVYSVLVYADEPGADEEKLVFSNDITFVAVDEHGNKTSLRSTGV